MSALLSRMEARAGESTFTLIEAGQGRYEARGALTFATARRALAAGLAALAASRAAALEVDCTGVSSSDSAGLAVLIEWLAWARREGRELRYTGLPEAIRAIAGICEVEGLLSGGAAGSAMTTSGSAAGATEQTERG